MAAKTTDDFGQPLFLPPGEDVWPVLPGQEPEVVSTVEEFMECVYFQPHVDRIVVLRDGIRLLGNERAIPPLLQGAIRESSCTRELMERLSVKALDTYKGRIWHFGRTGWATEIVDDGETKALGNVKNRLAKYSAEGKLPPDAPLYLTELRHLTRTKHPLVDESVKTATQIDVYDHNRAVARAMPFWERCDGGIFIGERGSGSGLHVDQVLWSNVGRNWSGFKLLAIWPWSEQCSILDDAGRGRVFHFPLSDEDRALLRRAKTVALVQPGDAWVFCGGQPHTALTVGGGLSVCAYESFVPANKAGLHTFLRTNTKDHWKRCWSDDDDLDEITEEIVDNIQGALLDFHTPPRLRAALMDCAEEMRENGCTYCRRLWAIEDRRERAKRRRVDPSHIIKLDAAGSDSSPGPASDGSSSN
eukprot:TRINITY_DN6237_c0_g1_i1.p1 TRINITY_DN6237_c0_g1~~TRINITY_DN6237_c0_g1_i1.p1  ORF type:complete len:416 (+),score=67.93 TRINITY_DN6237_c0_g1_i1:255-1502(+)